MVKYLFVPSVLRGNGSGHILRCFYLAASLGKEAAVYLPREADNARSYDELRLAYPKETRSVRIIDSLNSDARFELVILDNRETKRAFLLAWKKHGTVVAVDEGGEARDYADYTIDILPPQKKMTSSANKTELGFLSLPAARREEVLVLKKMLVSFGGEDSLGLAERFVQSVVRQALLSRDNIFVVSGALSQNKRASDDGIMRFAHVQDLKEMFHSYDLVVTQFGLTAFEAAWAGAAVLVYNSSAVHESLTKKAGFYSLGLNVQTESALDAAVKKAFADFKTIIAMTKAARPRERLDFAAFIRGLKPSGCHACVSSGQNDMKAVYRDERKTYFLCPDCGLYILRTMTTRALPYVHASYFFDEYKAQYGRTYLEDMPQLRKAAARRLAVMEKLCPKNARVLDVGCAYGAFVAEAEARGWNPVASDISEDAVRYVQDTFAIPAVCADFGAPHTDGFYPRELDALTMWYVIEHFVNLERVLTRAGQLLKQGGVLAFSTPSYRGISGRKNLKEFLRASPNDHYTVWSPRAAASVLKRYGFTVKRIIVTGHHPERFPHVTHNPRSILYKAVYAISNLFRLGDTFECYAVYSGRPHTTEHV